MMMPRREIKSASGMGSNNILERANSAVPKSQHLGESFISVKVDTVVLRTMHKVSSRYRCSIDNMHVYIAIRATMEI